MLAVYVECGEFVFGHHLVELIPCLVRQFSRLAIVLHALWPTVVEGIAGQGGYVQTTQVGIARGQPGSVAQLLGQAHGIPVGFRCLRTQFGANEV